eukprot:TRINITY_DN5660_c1_g1_i1.p1 TRINITY_DN5660_c1_g1~~TRINITY_DN5660_c1_g1_i1.p1  ORF type:complete len:111 (-),score=16.80 TRINITY_DN5660_c1_g1_i1:68-400(-)
MYGKTRKDAIKIKHTQEHLGVASIGHELRETHLRWFEISNVGQRRQWRRKAVLCRLMTPEGRIDHIDESEGRIDHIDESSKDRSEEVKSIQGFGPRWTGMMKQIHVLTPT